MSRAPLAVMKRTTVYRYLTGPDDSTFCHRVSEALAKGWTLYGDPTLTFDGANNRLVCGQAVTKDLDGVGYSPDLKLGDL
ncbi:MAG TPA: DUF1737 domain-containing protein [Beijerinckiaceae bacterium]|nr:DUF1737 domain-containing protein [Beijerinckiaceae bacterium]